MKLNHQRKNIFFPEKLITEKKLHFRREKGDSTLINNLREKKTTNCKTTRIRIRK